MALWDHDTILEKPNFNVAWSFWNELSDEVASKLSRSVVSIALYQGEYVLFASSGIAIECQSNFTKFVTSAVLVRALNDERNVHDDIEIKVHHEGSISIGTVEEYDLDHVIAVVKVTPVLDVYCVPLSYANELTPGGKVVAVGRDISGKLMATSGTLTASDRSEDCGHLMLSTSKLSEVLPGGAIFEFDGNFVGMNLFWNMERPIFLPRDIILDRLNHLRTSMEKILFCEMLKLARKGRLGRLGVELCSHPEGSMNVDTFEEHFGDKYPTGVWGEFKKEIHSNISDIVVALASFHGDFTINQSSLHAREFSLTDGRSIILTSASLVRDPDGANEIMSSLRVLLPNNEKTAGTLEHYSLQYNVALISVKNYNADGLVKLEPETIQYDLTVVAVGRCFESGLLMAASGKYVEDDEVPDVLDCGYLWYTTCKTTKAVIGGPLVDLDGKFMGINYYDTELGTPFLFFSDIWEILEGMLDDLKTKKATIGGHKARLRHDDGPPFIWVSPA